MQANIKSRTIFYGKRCNNLHVLRGMDSDSVDLIATDPPFNKNMDFNSPVKRYDKKKRSTFAARQSFKDRWYWDAVTDEWFDLLGTDYPGVKEVIEAAAVIEGGSVTNGGLIVSQNRRTSTAAYLTYMAPILIEMRRVLKPSGSAYVHCDYTANSYLRLLMDAIFGPRLFMNAIVWQRAVSRNDGRWGHVHDTILYYAPERTATWNPEYGPLSEGGLKAYNLKDSGGRYQLDNVSFPGGGGYSYDFGLGERMPAGGYRMPEKTARQWLAEGRLVVREGKVPRQKKYLRDSKGAKLNDVWTTPLLVQGNSKENVGWKTQKPVSLYRRIIRASSNPGDVVLDPFCGCATTMIASEIEGRRWVGIDKDEETKKTISRRFGQLHEEKHVDEVGDSRSDLLDLINRPMEYRKRPPSRTDVEIMSDSKLREVLWRMQAHRCANPYCTSDGVRVVDLHLDHRIPKSRGGADEITNRIGLCGNCNQKKATKSWGQFLDEERAKQPHQRK